MKTFVISDIHGRPDALESLLVNAGIVESGQRNFVDPDHGEPFKVVSIGDLANGVFESQEGDRDCFRAVENGWIDTLILGNHEAPYLYRHLPFGGFHRWEELNSLYNRFVFQGIVVPAVLVGGTLITHAGVNSSFLFNGSREAYDEIVNVYENYSYLRLRSKTSLIDGIGRMRGGWDDMGGILWSNWDEPKNENFNQIVGHTPMKDGPHTKLYENEYWTMNIDCSAKSGKAATGVWLDAAGNVLSVIKGKKVSDELPAFFG